MSRLVPIVLLTAFAVYVVWSDSTSVEPLDTPTMVIDAVIVSLAAWSWISFLRGKSRDDVNRE